MRVRVDELPVPVQEGAPGGIPRRVRGDEIGDDGRERGRLRRGRVLAAAAPGGEGHEAALQRGQVRVGGRVGGGGASGCFP